MSHLFSKGTLFLYTYLFNCGFVALMSIFIIQEDIEKALSSVSRSSRGLGFSQHILVQLALHFQLQLFCQLKHVQQCKWIIFPHHFFQTFYVFEYWQVGSLEDVLKKMEVIHFLKIILKRAYTYVKTSVLFENLTHPIRAYFPLQMAY